MQTIEANYQGHCINQTLNTASDNVVLLTISLYCCGPFARAHTLIWRMELLLLVDDWNGSHNKNIFHYGSNLPFHITSEALLRFPQLMEINIVYNCCMFLLLPCYKLNIFTVPISSNRVKIALNGFFFFNFWHGLLSLPKCSPLHILYSVALVCCRCVPYTHGDKHYGNTRMKPWVHNFTEKCVAFSYGPIMLKYRAHKLKPPRNKAYG